MNEAPVLLHLGAQSEMVPGILRLKAEGFRVLAIDPYPHPPGFAYVDGFASIDLTDVRGVTSYAKQVGAQAILAVNEYGVLAAALASRQLGLLNISPRVGARARDKALMRDRWSRAGLPQPRYQRARTFSEIHTAACKIGYPLILKPTTNCGSRGVSRVSSADELAPAFAFATQHGRGASFMLEEFIPGAELTIDGVVQNGKVSILAISDKEHFPHPNYRVASALHFPAQIASAQLALLNELIPKAALGLGIQNGAFHCECIVNDKGVFLIEMGARPGGARIFGSLVELTSGIPLPVVLAQIFLRQEISLPTPLKRPVICKFFPLPRTLDPAPWKASIEKMPGIVSVNFRSNIAGKEVIATDVERPAQIIATGETRSQAIQFADTAIALLQRGAHLPETMLAQDSLPVFAGDSAPVSAGPSVQTTIETP